MATVGISIVRAYTEKVRPPRTLHLAWPFGHPLGMAFNRRQQAAVLAAALNALETVGVPGEIVDAPYAWSRRTYPPPPWERPGDGGVQADNGG